MNLELQLDVDLTQLIQIAEQLPEQKWDKLKSEVEQQSGKNVVTSLASNKFGVLLGAKIR